MPRLIYCKRMLQPSRQYSSVSAVHFQIEQSVAMDLTVVNVATNEGVGEVDMKGDQRDSAWEKRWANLTTAPENCCTCWNLPTI